MSQLFLIVQLPKQIDQIFQFANEFDDDEPYPVSVAVDGAWVYARDTASCFEFRFCSDPSLIQSHDVGHELPDAMCVVILYRVMIDYNLEFPVQNRISDKWWNAGVTVLIHEFSKDNFIWKSEGVIIVAVLTIICFHFKGDFWRCGRWGTARREDSPLGMSLPAPPERNIRRPFLSDVVPVKSSKNRIYQSAMLIGNPPRHPLIWSPHIALQRARQIRRPSA